MRIIPYINGDTYYVRTRTGQNDRRESLQGKAKLSDFGTRRPERRRRVPKSISFPRHASHIQRQEIHLRKTLRRRLCLTG